MVSSSSVVRLTYLYQSCGRGRPVSTQLRVSLNPKIHLLNWVFLGGVLQYMFTHVYIYKYIQYDTYIGPICLCRIRHKHSPRLICREKVLTSAGQSAAELVRLISGGFFQWSLKRSLASAHVNFLCRPDPFSAIFRLLKYVPWDTCDLGHAKSLPLGDLDYIYNVYVYIYIVYIYMYPLTNPNIRGPWIHIYIYLLTFFY